jgi:pyruvate carboxylase
MAGLCKPFAAGRLAKALHDEVGLPIHFHTHDTSGAALASCLEAARNGVSIVDAAMAPLPDSQASRILMRLLKRLETLN